MSSIRTIAVVTGTRAEFGLLRSVMRAIQRQPALNLRVIAAGSHLLPPQHTIEEVRKEFEVSATVQMQNGKTTERFADAEAVGRGIAGFAREFATNDPDVVLVLGDRIEAFAASAAASVSGIRVAHMHGGDRAEGIADEAMRHAITKLAHVHLPATQHSALRIIAMGEDPKRVHIVGSPAMDELAEIPPLSDREFAALGSPEIVVLLHPVGDQDSTEFDRASKLLDVAQHIAPTLVLHPNHDPGRKGIMRAIEAHCDDQTSRHSRSDSAVAAGTITAAGSLKSCAHLPREKFIGLLRRVKVIVGNSSAGLIECAAIPIRAINIGRRQAGRETPSNVVNMPVWDYQTIRDAIVDAVGNTPLTGGDVAHPYGDGRTGERVAKLLAALDEGEHPIVKQNAY